MARNGGIYKGPRYVLQSITDWFVDMVPNRQANWCCGGGSGLVAIGEKEFRMKSAKVKANQIRDSRADIVCSACENCHSQLSDLNEHYGLGVEVEFLSNLVAEALVQQEAAVADEEALSMRASVNW